MLQFAPRIITLQPALSISGQFKTVSGEKGTLVHAEKLFMRKRAELLGGLALENRGFGGRLSRLIHDFESGKANFQDAAVRMDELEREERITQRNAKNMPLTLRTNKNADRKIQLRMMILAERLAWLEGKENPPKESIESIREVLRALGHAIQSDSLEEKQMLYGYAIYCTLY